MEIKIKMPRAAYALLSTALLFTACQKSETVSNEENTAASTIAVAASATAAAGDSVYIVQPCGRGGRRDSVAFSSLPAAAGTYLSANYAGYTFHKAFAVSANNVVTGYAVIVYFNNKPVGLLFDTAGTFVRVLEQRDRGDLSGPGFHSGGRFEHRDGRGRDSIALATLPTAITAYLASNYPGDTLLKAFRSRDSSIVVLSKNVTAFATVFSAAGAFVKRQSIHSAQGNCQPVDLAALPSAAAAYLGLTFPNYVFNKAFVISQNGTVKGYVAVIDANNTRYAVEFNAAGTFIRTKTIH